jgi:hypothetical protein
MTASLGRPVTDLDDFLEVAPDTPQPVAAEPTPEPRHRAAWAGWSIMAAAVVLMAGGVGYWLLRRPPAPETATGTASVAGVSAMPTGVPGFAEMFLASYLTGASDSLGEFLPGAPPLTAMTPAVHYVTRTAAMEVTRIGADYWRVIVAADVLTLSEGAYHPAGLQYFQIGVVDDGGRLVAVALPARVGGPAPRPTAPRVLQVADWTPTDEQTALVGDFLEALLTDRRDLERYVSPGSAIDPISPAPYQTVSVASVALFGDGSALVTVDAQAGGAIDSMQYVIRFSNEGARPSVAELLAGPPPISRAAPGGS